jgi:hypothetical protein
MTIDNGSHQPTGTPSSGISAAGEPLATPAVRLGSYLLEMILAVVTLGIGWMIWSLVVWGKGTTPGHQILRLYIIDAKTGTTATWGHVALREFVIKGLLGGILSFVTLGIYWIVDSFFVLRADRKTIHDMISSTNVVQR